MIPSLGHPHLAGEEGEAAWSHTRLGTFPAAQSGERTDAHRLVAWLACNGGHWSGFFWWRLGVWSIGTILMPGYRREQQSHNEPWNGNEALERPL